MNCLFCSKKVSFIQSIMMHLSDEKQVRICFECVRVINNNVAHRYKLSGWMITNDTLIVNKVVDLTEESA